MARFSNTFRVYNERLNDAMSMQPSPDNLQEIMCQVKRRFGWCVVCKVGVGQRRSQFDSWRHGVWAAALIGQLPYESRVPVCGVDVHPTLCHPFGQALYKSGGALLASSLADLSTRRATGLRHW